MQVKLSTDQDMLLNFAQGWGYSVSVLDTFLLKLFEKYAELLKRRFSDDFQEVSLYKPTEAEFVTDRC